MRTIRHWVGGALGLAALLLPFLAPSTAAIACAVMLVVSGDANVEQLKTGLASSNSKVVLAWDYDRNIDRYQVALTIAMNYHGAPQEFAAVIPVPTFIERKQIGVVDIAAISALDLFTEPHLSQEYDDDPCHGPTVGVAAAPGAQAAERGARPAVTVEANYDVGEYDVSILSATENKSLLEWLNGHGYTLPAGAAAILGDYIGQGMHFFVAKVNLQRMPLLKGQFLRPLQVRYQARDIMLPIRLGTVNATGLQELIIYTLSRVGRVEVANYPTVEMPSGVRLPVYVGQDLPHFRQFYDAVFDRVVARNRASAYLESAKRFERTPDGIFRNDGFGAMYTVSQSRLIELGARWIGQDQTSPAFLTRLHIRYDAAHFPEDLKFKETAKPDFEVNYLLRHPWWGESDCAAGQAYLASLPQRYAQEVRDLAKLTGWPEDEIRAGMAATGAHVPK